MQAKSCLSYVAQRRYNEKMDGFRYSKRGSVVTRTARDVMRTDVVTVRPDATLDEAVKLLLENRISGLPVTDDSGMLVGVISEFALLVVTYNAASRKQPVQDHMSKHVINVAPDTPLKELADTFILQRIRRVSSRVQVMMKWTRHETARGSQPSKRGRRPKTARRTGCPANRPGLPSRACAAGPATRRPHFGRGSVREAASCAGTTGSGARTTTNSDWTKSF